MPISGAAGTEGADNARRAIQDQKKSTISLPIASNSLRAYVKKEARSRLGTKCLKGCTAEKNRSEDVKPKSILVHLYARVESSRSGMDSDLEAFSRYPADGSSAAPPGRTAAKTNYLNERFQPPAAIRGTRLINFTDPEKAMAKLWKVLSKMKVFEEWEAYQVYGVRVKDNGKCDYFTPPAPPSS